MRVVVGPPSWKEKVVGYAKKFRGTMLRQVRVYIYPTFTAVLIFVGANLDSLRLRNTEARSSEVKLPLTILIKYRTRPDACKNPINVTRSYPTIIPMLYHKIDVV